MPLRNAQAQLAVLPAYARPRGARRDPGRGERGVQPGPARADARGRGAGRRLLGHRRSGRAERGGEGHLAARALDARSKRRATRRRRPTAALRERWFARLLGADRAEVPSSYHTSYMRRLSPLEATYTKDRATEICLADARRARLRPRGADEHQARPRRPSAEVAARLRDRERSAEGRAPDHARAGRAARLPGVPARGGARAPLRAAATRTAVHLPAHLARSRADGDLLVHRRGDLARARVARAATSGCRRSRRARTPRRRRSSRRCSSAATRRSCASSSTSGRGSRRRRRRRTATRSYLTAATGMHTAGRLPLRHGRGLLLGGLPARVDPLGAAARAPRREVGADWWRNPQTGDLLRDAVPRGHEADERGDRGRIGFDPLDTAPLLHEIGA